MVAYPERSTSHESDETSPTTHHPQKNYSLNRERRLFVRKLAAGSAAVAGCSLLPETWTTPFVSFATLPAHATTSGDILALIEEIENSTGIENQVAEEVTSQQQDQNQTVEPAAATTETNASKSVETSTPQAQTATTLEEKTVATNDLHGFSNSLTLNNVGDQMSCDSVWQDKFVFSKLGPQYGKSFLLVWSDGRELEVPNSESMQMNTDPNDYRKYQPGGVYSHNNPDIPTMEVYAARGTHPGSVTLYY